MKTPFFLRLLPAAVFLATSVDRSFSRPLFQEDFPTTTLTQYISGTAPHQGQFTDISAELNGGSWSLVTTGTDPLKPENTLRLTR